MSEFTQSICEDGAAILKDGQLLTIDQIICALNRAEKIALNGMRKLAAFDKINDICWSAKGRGETHIPINKVLDVIEHHCEP